MKYIIPSYLVGKDFYAQPNYYREHGGKFRLSYELTDKDFEFLISVGLEIIRNEAEYPEIPIKAKKK